MTIETFIKELPVITVQGELSQSVGRLCIDSRAVRPGDTFVAMKGLTVDGHDYIEKALLSGAALIFSQKPLSIAMPYVAFDNVSLAALAARYYGNPGDKLQMVGVTGTNGKTTVTHILHEFLCRIGVKAGLIGTNRVRIGTQDLSAERTTPDALELQALLAGMAAAGCTHCVMEVSSHALDLGRVEHIHYQAAGFTNLTQDHLDFHHSMEAYYEAKRKLFDQSEKAVINGADLFGTRLEREISCQCLVVNVCKADNLYAKSITLNADSVAFTAVYKQEEVPLVWHTPGLFSVENALIALGLGLSLGFSLTTLATHFTNIPPVKGRMEVVPFSPAFTVLIDFAHTPDAMDNTLRTLRGTTLGRLITVFGCGGNRDRSKRPQMGAIATKLSDITVVTSDNPRHEPPQSIIEDILQGCTGEVTAIAERRDAIGWALNAAQPGDVVLLCGKGHETYQEIAGVKYPMDERKIVASFLGVTDGE